MKMKEEKRITISFYKIASIFGWMAGLLVVGMLTDWMTESAWDGSNRLTENEKGKNHVKENILSHFIFIKWNTHILDLSRWLALTIKNYMFPFKPYGLSPSHIGSHIHT